MTTPVFFRMARAGKRVTAAWWAVLIGIAIIVVRQIVGGTVFVSLLAAGLVPGETMDLENMSFELNSFGSAGLGIFLLTTFFFIALFTFLWIWLFEKRSLASFGLGRVGAGLFKFARGGVLAIIVMAMIAFGMQATGMAELTDSTVPSQWIMVWPLLVLILGWCVQGSAEEILTRGLLFQSLGARHGLITAVIISSLFFSVMHGMNPNPSALFFVNLALFSLFACLYALREASLWGICGYHAFWNFAQGNLFGLPVSGMAAGDNAWFAFSSTGPAFITGGATGPEGGLVTTLALAVSAVVILAIKPDAHAKEIANAAEQEHAAAQEPAAE